MRRPSSGRLRESAIGRKRRPRASSSERVQSMGVPSAETGAWRRLLIRDRFRPRITDDIHARIQYNEPAIRLTTAKLGYLKKSLEGISQIVRVTRTPLSIVAIIMTGLMALIFVILVFAPIPDIAKYVGAGVCFALLATAWFQFWNKAKHEPLTATEEYYIQELKLKYSGSVDERQLPEDVNVEPRRHGRKTEEIERLSDESDSEK